MPGSVKKLEENVVQVDFGESREERTEQKGGRGRDGAGRRRRRSRSGGGEYEEAEEVEKAEEKDASALYGIQLSLHNNPKRELEDWIPAGAEAGAGAGKATVVQWLYMLLEQTTDSRDREELECPVTSRGGTGVGLSGANGVPFTCASGSTLAAVACADAAVADTAGDRAAVVANSEAVEDPWVMRKHYFSRSLNGGGRAEAGVWGLCVHVAGGEASGAEE
ncbi:uncharacterized protein MONOS_10267 [Monocercomonoides exilis]|uniref:uncharacterized protein n=1 Tax=Monocercomonoides exilis TaxID=2049356 RepID=UPI00355AA786|nr:hypothetical protein MONOS_10267 [Monocercomonoides exilis]|eukprot:MONOS_10267.1-p1 / transcript=MONOS_10267.1 / gene=MONOS_10267 / organism=Monocercomonoides_exilis_PA203 / gene_product=unspecified product / transcript_product=unspecified product / location=Mono_scaffold00459:32779-33518(+) / protein_length=221 / sequence_SO=supercontig / SO=protein_coding / is_pseudo=false